MPEVRLIDANALLKKCIEGDGDNKFTEGYNFAVQEISAYIALAPTIEPEVRHGRWETWGYVFHGIEWKRCSRCGKCAGVSYYGLLDGKIEMETPARCGCCGARMDGGADNG